MTFQSINQSINHLIRPQTKDNYLAARNGS